MYFPRNIARLAMLAWTAVSVAPAMAACSGQLCSDVLITKIITDGGTANWISTSGAETSLSCTPDSSELILIDPSVTKPDWVYASLLTAYTTRQTVTIRTTGSGTTCKIVYMIAATP